MKLLSTPEFIKHNRQKEEVVLFKYKKKTFLNLKGVYPFCEDSKWFLENNPIKSGEVLEIGCGNGLLSLHLAFQGLNVTAVDINIEAVRNAFLNSILHKTKINTMESDVFHSISGLYDNIFWNVPFNHSDKEVDMVESAYYDHNYQNLEDYISNFKRFLAPNGSCYIFTSLTNMSIETIKLIAHKYDCSVQLVKSKKFKNLKFSLDILCLR